MEKNHIIGFILLFATLFVMSYLNKPSELELEKRKRMQDSIAAIRISKDSLNEEAIATSEFVNPTPVATVPDSIMMIQNTGIYGAFSASSMGEEVEHFLENEKVKITFSNKGGMITSVLLKDYVKKIYKRGEETLEEPVVLLGDERNKFEYLLPVGSAASGVVSTSDLYFDVRKNGQTIIFSAKTNTGSSFIQKYSLGKRYNIDYDIDYSGLDKVLDARAENIDLNWENYLHSYERNEKFEQQYSAIYFKENEDDDTDDCGCMKDEKIDFSDTKLDWISHSNQYFNSALMAPTIPFSSGKIESISNEIPKEGKADHIEKLTSRLTIPYKSSGGKFDMAMYVGPNEYNDLEALNFSLEYIIPFGNTIFGTINRYVIRPVFDWMSKYIGSLGIVIIIVIFLLKMLLYPFMYKMLHSQALMGALKPKLAHLTDKFKDEPQKKQMETMKIYKEYGVSPLGGCLPMIIQMPIWYALFRFFPASISFRQESFLWAHDLSSYDDFFHLPFEIPFVGDHLSLFTILYSVSMLVYTYYNTKHMDMSANPAMKYMQYFMPVMFFGFFNTYASGLTCYMFFSNLINITQTVVTKKFVFSDEKLQAELKLKKAKPKKKGGFQQRMEEALKQQQAAQTKKTKKPKK